MNLSRRPEPTLAETTTLTADREQPMTNQPTSGLVWPTRTAIPTGLPELGLCSHCEGEIRIRKNGALYAHGCTGNGRKPVSTLEPTFVRWLYAQSKRHDGRINPLTSLAQYVFVGCTRSHHRTVADVHWVTAEELHEEQHRRQKRWTGSDVRQPYNGQRCDWMCEDIETACEAHAALLAAQLRTGSNPWAA